MRTSIRADWPPSSAVRCRGLRPFLQWRRSVLAPNPLSAFDGLCLPIGFNSYSIGLASAWCQALRSADSSPLRAWFREAFEGPCEMGPSPSWTPALPEVVGRP